MTRLIFDTSHLQSETSARLASASTGLISQPRPQPLRLLTRLSRDLLRLTGLCGAPAGARLRTLGVLGTISSLGLGVIVGTIVHSLQGLGWAPSTLAGFTWGNR